MHSTQAILASLFAASAAFAAPAVPTPTSSSSISTSTSTSTAASESDWVIQGLVRECNKDNASCAWTFGIFDGSTTTDCTYIVDGIDASGGPTQCGDFSVQSNYAPGDPPFTQITIVRDGLIIYPGYDENVLANPPVADFTQAPQPTP